MNEKQKTTKKSTVKVNASEATALVQQLNRDVRDSILVVSLLVNAYIVIGWLIIQVSNGYEAQIINYLQTN